MTIQNKMLPDTSVEEKRQRNDVNTSHSLMARQVLIVKPKNKPNNKGKNISMCK